MKYVEIYKLNDDTTQTVVVICELGTDGIVECSGTGQDLIRSLIEDGIKDYGSGGKLLLSDGIKFLEQLKFNFKSGYLNASEVLEGPVD